MEMQTTNPEQPSAAEAPGIKVRRKIWQISHSYHCSIIGMCLSRHDLRLLARKKIFEISSGSSDYEIHRELSGTADVRSPKNRQLSKYLDTRHAKAIRRYVPLQQEEEFRRQWQADINSGDAAGAYWAIMTHPQVNPELASYIYGEGHILGYDSFAQARKEVIIQDRLRDENSNLLQQQQDLRQRLTDTSARNVHLEQRLREAGEQLAISERQLESEKANREDLEKRILFDTSQQDMARLKQLVYQQEKENCQLRQQMAALQEKLLGVERQLQTTTREKLNLFGKLEDLNQQLNDHRQEVALLEHIALAASPGKEGCRQCPDFLIDKQTGCGLCGKTVLYVGGRASMIPHYKQLIEQRGGSFLHHDGGKENSRQLLPKLLCGADAVLCPIDCVSHDACLCVKKICKQYQKPFVMMRSSGLSSLARTLESIQ